MAHTQTDHTTTLNQVRAFYNAHPYPPPVKNLDDYRLRWQDPSRRRADFHLFFPDKPYQDTPTILVAGCGTSQAAKYALRHPTADVVGIDVSQTAIEHTQTLKRKYNLNNLEVRRLSIEQAGNLERHFSKVVCTGVLHHLPNPNAGLQALRNVLEPDGAMHLMVYAAYGRSGIYMLQDYARRLGIGHTDKEINDFAATLTALPPSHPLAQLLGQSPDFRRKDALADALLNPQDRAYTVPQLFDFIDQGGLTFGRWFHQAPYLPRCGALAATPHRNQLAQLPDREQYAAVELFRGTMLRHSFIGYRSDHPNRAWRVSFAGDDWLGFKPLRQAETISVQKRLPPGAAAVLINQAHTYSDLILPVNVAELRLLQAIDGQQRIADLIRRSQLKRRQALAFLEKLWHYDQIVFDTST